MARIKHTPRKEGIMACTKQTGEDLPASSKRRAATFVVKPNKRLRADVKSAPTSSTPSSPPLRSRWPRMLVCTGLTATTTST